MEIGHVLAMDVVGYSKLLISEQTELLRRFSEIVRSTAQVRAVDAEGNLIRLPTGALRRLDPMFDPLRNDPRFQKLTNQK